MTDADYRDMAIEIRELIPLLVHPQTVADLRLLADRYERLAHFLEVVAGKLSDTRFECRVRRADIRRTGVAEYMQTVGGVLPTQ